MLKSLLVRGMIVGVIAGMLGFGMARLYGEPQVDKAIAFETWLDQQKEKAAEAAKAQTTASAGMSNMQGMAQSQDSGGDVELVSRPVQASWGLLTAVLVYGASMGGIFALVYAFSLGRFTGVSPRGLAALLALAAFITIAIAPDLKYPANPPSVGNPDTIGPRTGLYLSMLVISIGAMVSAVLTARSLYRKHGLWTAVIAGGALYIVIASIGGALLPDVQEVPAQFPAIVLWRFRVANLGIQAVIWTSMGLLFGYLTERSFQVGRAVLRPAH
jgi:predicted cobalt transporter CbtA